MSIFSSPKIVDCQTPSKVLKRLYKQCHANSGQANPYSYRGSDLVVFDHVGHVYVNLGHGTYLYILLGMTQAL